MTDAAVIDTAVGPEHGRAERRRRGLLRIAPFFAIVLVVGGLIAVTVLNYQANRREILIFADDLIAILEQRVRAQVGSVLRPADRAVALGAGLIARGAADAELEKAGASILAAHDLLSAIYVGRPDGDFLMVQRNGEGGFDTRMIAVDGEHRTVTWTRRDAGRNVVAEETVADDPFDPVTRPWYRGALDVGADNTHWTRPYRFFTTGQPGITAARAVRTDSGAVTAIVGADIEIGTLSRFLGDLEVVRSGRAVLIGGDGQLVAAPILLDREGPRGDDDLPTVEALGDRYLIAAYDRMRVERATRTIVTIEGERHVLAVSSLADLLGRDLWVMILVPESDFTGFLVRNSGIVLAVSGALVAGALALAALLALQSRRIDRRLRLVDDRDARLARLSRAFEQVRSILQDGRTDLGHAGADLAETLARAAGAGGAHVWRRDGDALRCLGCFDAGQGGQTLLPPIESRQAPALFEALETGETVAVPTGVLSGVSPSTGTGQDDTAWVSPITGADGAIGMVVLEAPAADRLPAAGVALLADYAAAIAAAIVGTPKAADGRLSSGGVAPEAAMSAVAAGGPDPRLAGGDLGRIDLVAADASGPLAAPGAGGSAVSIPGLAVLDIALADDDGLGRPVGPDRPLLDAIIEAVREVAEELGLGPVRMFGDRIQIITGLQGGDAAAVETLVDAALTLQSRLRALYLSAGAAPAFAMGLDAAAGLGWPVGDRPPVIALWGRPVRVARQLADTAPGGSIQVGDRVAGLLAGTFIFRRRGRFHLSGGAAVESYLVIGRAQ